MARPPRIEYSGAHYHVIDRGIERRTIFSGSDDYECFLGLCGALKVRHKVELLAYCVMPNHYHLLVRTSLANLNRYMKELNGGYSRAYNRRRRRIGPLYAGRYKALLVEDDAYALSVARYIHMNPVKAGLVDRPEDYRWSSYREYLGRGAAGVADTACLFGYFRGSHGERIRQFRELTTDRHAPEYDPLGARGGVVVGGEGFMEWLRKEFVPRVRPPTMARWREIWRPGPGLKASMMTRINGLTSDSSFRQKLLVYALKKGTPLSLKEIAHLTGMKTIMAVSMVVSRLDRARRSDEALGGVLARLDGRLRTGRQSNV